MTTDASKIRNLAIIAHIDHGKTTLIDSIFRSCQTFRENAQVETRVMDSHALERERGITIRSKLCNVQWNGYHINIIDTPGHADFSGEVERVLSMADSVLLLVDANEGPMPQTRYVLMRSLRLGLKPIVIVNKVDRPNADPDGALEKTFDLFLELGASDEQTDFPILYGSGLNGWFVRDLDKDEHENGMEALFETIVEHVPPPDVIEDAPFRMQVTNIGWNEYIGRIGCGRVLEGSHKVGEALIRTMTKWRSYEQEEGEWDVTGKENIRSSHLWITEGLELKEVEEVSAGDIIWFAGPKDLDIGDTISVPSLADPALPPLDIEEPTVSMLFLVNTSPFASKEGKAVTLRELKARIEKELRVNVALRMEDMGRADGVKVSGRGELHLAILIEEMRREGLEFCVSRQEVVTKRDENDKLLEPLEMLFIDVPEEYQGPVIESLARRKGDLVNMEVSGHGTIRLEYKIPTRGIIGYRNEFLTTTRGLGIMASRFIGYTPYAGEIAARSRGAMVAMENGPVTAYSIENLQDRGTLFVKPMQEVYTGQIVGECAKPGDLPCKPTKAKHVTNHRSANKEQTVVLDAPRIMGLDAALEWISDDELVEVTPESVRIRKTVLDFEERRRAEKQRASLAS